MYLAYLVSINVVREFEVTSLKLQLITQVEEYQRPRRLALKDIPYHLSLEHCFIKP